MVFRQELMGTEKKRMKLERGRKWVDPKSRAQNIMH